MATPEKPHVVVWTDGACSGNPGPGGWAAIMLYGHHEKILHGGERHTTNNRMELTAVIAALEALKRPSVLEVHTDSTYLKTTSSIQDVAANEDLWQRYHKAATGHEVIWHVIKGHAGLYYNTRADELARKAVPPNKFEWRRKAAS